jgi:hypothetical protein
MAQTELAQCWLAEVGKVTFTINDDEALSDESV